jgi:hypothetical protein
MQFVLDQSFADESLRLLSAVEMDPDQVRGMVKAARETYAILSSEQGWSEAESIRPLTLLLVPHSTLCNPDLYEKGGAPTRCREQDAWYRPVEHSLYLVPPPMKEMQGLLDYWVAMATCIHSTAANCTDVIQAKLGK